MKYAELSRDRDAAAFRFNHGFYWKFSMSELSAISYTIYNHSKIVSFDALWDKKKNSGRSRSKKMKSQIEEWKPNLNQKKVRIQAYIHNW